MQNLNLHKHFHEKLFKPEMEATTKEEVLEELLDLFVANQYVKDKHLILEMLHKRETMGTTALGKGVAVPHGRTIATGDMIIAFGHSSAGVDFSADDGKLVTLFFMIIAPPNDEGNVYLPVLGAIVTILKDTKKRTKLNKVESYEEFLAVINGEE
jgi:mannitol/fructose-specific phosphotransferase system IIA component (Ntr-type)